MNTLVEICWCGHHKDTHHDKGKADCLGLGCNVDPNKKDCPYFRDRTKPDPIAEARAKRTHPDRWNRLTQDYEPCLCYSCKKARGLIK